MQQLTALDELNEYIAKSCDDDIIGNICKPLKRCESLERVSIYLCDKQSDPAPSRGFLERLKQREVSRRRQHRNLRWNFNHDYVGNMIDLFDVSYGEDDDYPPPPPPYLLEQVSVFTSRETGNVCTRSYSDHSLLNESHSIFKASIDSACIASSGSLLVQSDAEQNAAIFESANGDLTLASSRGRRQRSRKILNLKLNANVGGEIRLEEVS